MKVAIYVVYKRNILQHWLEIQHNVARQVLAFKVAHDDSSPSQQALLLHFE